MGSFLGDLRYSLRTLCRNPGFTIVALFSLALGIGANTTIFSVFSTIALRPFPVNEPNRLAIFYEAQPERQGFRGPTYTTFLELKKQSQSFEDWAITSLGGLQLSLAGQGKAEQIRICDVGPNFFSTVGVPPALGTSFGKEYSGIGIGESDTVVISHGLWQRFFGADPNILGQTVKVTGFPKTIVGVMPPGFWVFPWAKDVDLWLAHDLSLANVPNARWLRPIARLKEGVTIEQAQAEMDVISRRLEELDPEAHKGWNIRVEGLRDWSVSGYAETLYLLMGAVAFVLLIACANVANLLLARATAREKEIAVRASMGATRLSLLRQLLTESLVLAVLGGVLGVLLSLIGIRIFIVMAPTWLFRAEEVSIDHTVLAFTLGVSLLAGVLFGILPALQASRPHLQEALKEGGRGSRGSGGRGRSVLVVAEVALALVLLVGAGLMANSFLRLQTVDPGFNPKNLFVVSVWLSGTQYWDYVEGDRKRATPQVLMFYEQVLERISALPGVISAATAGPAPPAGGWNRFVEIVGEAPPADGRPRTSAYCEVSPEFFNTLEIPLLKGRYLNDQDEENSPWVVVINDAMDRQFFPDKDPLGKSLDLSMQHGAGDAVKEEQPRTIVGVVGNIKRWNLKWGRRALMYGSHKQRILEYPGILVAGHVRKDFVIRTATPPLSLAKDVHRIIADADPEQAIIDTKTIEEALAEMVAPERFWMQLYGIFALLAVILAAVGIYGVMSYTVSQRTHEIGVRMAIGAQAGDVLKLVIRQGLKLTVIGSVIGVGGGFGLTRLISRYLYGVTPTDPLTYLVVLVFLAGVAVIACSIPARRAAKVDPAAALRYE
jgi:putative ABC transport system permease protein